MEAWAALKKQTAKEKMIALLNYCEQNANQSILRFCPVVILGLRVVFPSPLCIGEPTS